jgi:uncharacterized membrane protein YdfJ with MMPL/SSD domain
MIKILANIFFLETENTYQIKYLKIVRFFFVFVFLLLTFRNLVVYVSYSNLKVYS